jgi:glycosyltransferase involved in cell wall biosynthesis
VSVLALAHINEYLPACGALVTGVRVPAIPRTARVRRLINDILTPTCLRSRRPDIVHESYFSPRRATPARTPTVVTVYDMIPERLPDYFPAGGDGAKHKAAAVMRAHHVICISECTRRDLLARVPVDPDRVSVIHLAHSFPGGTGPSTRPGVHGDYVLYVGQRGGYKNFTALLSAAAASPAVRRGLRLVAFGGGRLTKEEVELIDRLGLPPGSVIQMGGDDAMLANLYAHALALVYPSLYEGFGIPPLEAMAMACPVICSETGSLPEVVGDAAAFFDPYSIDSIAAAIESVVGSADRSAELRRRGLVRAGQFSWDRCAAQTHAVYRSVLRAGGVS